MQFVLATISIQFPNIGLISESIARRVNRKTCFFRNPVLGLNPRNRTIRHRMSHEHSLVTSNHHTPHFRIPLHLHRLQTSLRTALSHSNPPLATYISWMHHLLPVRTLQLKHDRISLYLWRLDQRLMSPSILCSRRQRCQDWSRNDRNMGSDAPILMVVSSMVQD